MDDERVAVHNRRGYLNEDFLLFHLKDSKGEKYEYHYHDFYKIIVFISGRVTYLIEGKAHTLKPWDILLITNGDIHKAMIDAGEPYERIVIWFKPGFLEKNSSPTSNLLSCFDIASKEKQNLLRPGIEHLKLIKHYLTELEGSYKNNSFGNEIVKSSLLLLLAVSLNRSFLQAEPGTGSYKAQYDETVNKIVNHINEHISSDLSIESLSEKFYLSRYTLMHKFKKETGFTVHSFILQKRLLLAGTYIKKGYPVMEAGCECGFTDYSSFIRAFRKFYGMSPRQYRNDTASV